jgi:hypothetical protein
LVFGTKFSIFTLLNDKTMSQELIDFSALIDEQFDIVEFNEEYLQEYLSNLFN